MSNVKAMDLLAEVVATRELEREAYDLHCRIDEFINQPAAGDPVACCHRLADARNKHIASGYFCVDCGAAFAAADHATPPAAAHGETVAYRVIGDHGTPLTDWIDGNPGPDPVAMILGGRYVQRAYAAAHGDEAVRKDATESAIQRACGVLPEGWSMQIDLERDAGWVTLFNPWGRVVDFGQDFGSIGAHVEAAIDAAMRAQGGEGGDE